MALLLPRRFSLAQSVTIAFVLVAHACLPATATDFYVNPDTGDNGNDGLSPGGAWKTITFGLTQVPAGATLNLASGVYDTTSGESFPMIPGVPLSLVGAGTSETVIRGTSGQRVIVFDVLGEISHLNHLTITGGSLGIFAVGTPLRVDSAEVVNVEGAGILVLNQGDLTVTNSLIHNNTLSGINCVRSTASVEGSTIYRNGERGIVASLPTTSVFVEDCIIAENGQSGRTSGISLDADGIVSVKNSVILGTNGSALGTGRGTLIVKDCLLTNNEIGIDSLFGSTLLATQNVICGNLSRGVIVGGTGTGSFCSNSLVVGNIGRGIDLTDGGKGKLAFNNTVSRSGVGLFILGGTEGTFAGNISVENGFGLSESDNESDPETLNNLFFENPINYFDEASIPYNTESDINNLVGNGTAVVENNIVTDPLFIGGPSGNNTDLQYDPDNFQSVLTDSAAAWKQNKFKEAILYPNIDDNTFAYYIIENDTTTVRVWGDITDASFANTPLGATYEIVDYHLSRLSPAIDAGYDPAVETGDLDLDGNARIAGEAVDIGAYEFGACPVCPVVPTATITPTPTITPTTTQTPTATSTFTSMPTWTPLPTYTPFPTFTQPPTCEPAVTHAPGDLTGDGEANVEDLLELLRWWNP